MTIKEAYVKLNRIEIKRTLNAVYGSIAAEMEFLHEFLR